MSNEITVFINKVWQTKDFCLCFQINSQELAQKTFLIIDTKNKKEVVRLSNKKSTNITPNGNIANLIKKHISKKILCAILKETGDYPNTWLLFRERKSKDISFFLKLSYQQQVECSLISKDNKTLFRYGPKGTFTHIKEYKDKFINLNDSTLENYLKKILTDYLLFIKKSSTPSDKDQQSQSKSATEEKSFNQEIRKQLKRRLKTLKIACSKTIKNKITLEELKLIKEKAHQLKKNLHLIKKGDNQITLLHENTGLPYNLIIEIDPQISPGKNLDKIFIELEKKEKSYTFMNTKINQLEDNIKKINLDLIKVETKALNDSEVTSLLEKHKIKKKQEQKKQSTTERLPYKVFTDKNQVKYYVGKTARDNDTLVKKAKSNDLWFHVTGTTGSHVIVPRKSINKNVLLTDIKKFAGILSLYYSKSRLDQRGEVYFSKRNLITKKKNQAPGLWTINKSDSFFISFTNEELKNVLDHMEQ